MKSKMPPSVRAMWKFLPILFVCTAVAEQKHPLLIPLYLLIGYMLVWFNEKEGI